MLADAGYGISALSRPAISALGLLWAMGTVRIQKVDPADVRLVAFTTTRGRPRKTLIPDPESISAETMLAKTPGAGSPGGAAPRDRYKRGLPPCGAGGRWAGGSIAADRLPSICLGRKSGW